MPSVGTRDGAVCALSFIETSPLTVVNETAKAFWKKGVFYCVVP